MVLKHIEKDSSVFCSINFNSSFELSNGEEYEVALVVLDAFMHITTLRKMSFVFDRRDKNSITL